MLSLSPPDATVHFTSLSHSSQAALAKAFAPNTDPSAAPTATARPHTADVLTLIKELNIPLERVCLLDPRAEQEISPEDGEAFDMFLFGGILGEFIPSPPLHARSRHEHRLTVTAFVHLAGDDPPLDRTSILRHKGFPGRRLGPVQMTTDTALGVVKLVVHDKIPLEKIEYNEFPTIRFNEQESVEMPFRE